MDDVERKGEEGMRSIKREVEDFSAQTQWKLNDLEQIMQTRVTESTLKASLEQSEVKISRRVS